MRRKDLFEDELNAASSKHGVWVLGDLRLVSKAQFEWLKTGEVDKRKSYSALCFAKESVSDELLAAVSGRAPLVLQQATPVRVLNSRPVMVRPRTVHALRLSRVPNPLGEQSEGLTWIKADMETEAGTYVKEFINSDFGRTNPNLAHLLGLPSLDCQALDVTLVDLPWPPLDSEVPDSLPPCSKRTKPEDDVDENEEGDEANCDDE